MVRNLITLYIALGVARDHVTSVLEGALPLNEDNSQYHPQITYNPAPIEALHTVTSWVLLYVKCFDSAKGICIRKIASVL